MNEARICSACGKGAVESLRTTGRRMPFRNFESLDLPETLAIPTCTRCGEEWLDRRSTQALERALSDSAAKALTSACIKSIAGLSDRTTQRDLEILLDLSPGYLSKVKHGKEKPSALLTAVLALLAGDPEQRVDELRDVWAKAARSGRSRAGQRRHRRTS